MGKTDLHNRGSPLWKYPEVSGFPPEGGQEFNYQVSVPAGRRILKPEFHEKKGHLRRGKQSGGP
jgi:hypothetical protein